jgi:hypothetical protein
MITSSERNSEKRNRWAVAAMEFGYSCACCHRLPEFDDADSYLLSGYCRECWSAIPKGKPAPEGALTHL